MSLINDALIDLQRRQIPDGEMFEFIEIEPASLISDERKILEKIFIIFIFLILSISIYFLNFHDKESKKILGRENMESISSDTSMPNHHVVSSKFSIQSNEKYDHVMTPVLETKMTKDNLALDQFEFSEFSFNASEMVKQNETVSEGKTDSAQVVELIKQAEAALRKNRLTLPDKGSALYYINHALSISPNSLDARDTYAIIRSRFKREIDQAVLEKQERRLSRLLERFSLFYPVTREIQIYQGKLTELRRALTEEKETAEKVSEVISSSNLASSIDGQSAEYTWINATLDTKDQRAVDRARLLTKQGLHKQAEKELKTFLADEPNAIQAVIYLFDLWFRQNDWAEAQAFVSQLTPSHPALTYLNARQANQFHSRKRAIEILESQSPDERIAKQHNSLLAGLYQKTNQYAKAKEIYTNLAARYPSDVRIVLGLGLAADALGDNQTSASAYRSVLSLGHTNAKVLGFIQRRLSELNQQDLAEARQW